MTIFSNKSCCNFFILYASPIYERDPQGARLVEVQDSYLSESANSLLLQLILTFHYREKFYLN